MEIFWYFSNREWQAMEAPFPKFDAVTEFDESQDMVL
jgi:hypothetical protein